MVVDSNTASSPNQGSAPASSVLRANTTTLETTSLVGDATIRSLLAKLRKKQAPYFSLAYSHSHIQEIGEAIDVIEYCSQINKPLVTAYCIITTFFYFAFLQVCAIVWSGVFEMIMAWDILGRVILAMSSVSFVWMFSCLIRAANKCHELQLATLRGGSMLLSGLKCGLSFSLGFLWGFMWGYPLYPNVASGFKLGVPVGFSCMSMFLLISLLVRERNGAATPARSNRSRPS